MGKSKGLARMLVPSATVFFSSGCLMILELVASRLVARDLGSSLYTWTSVIGVVLAGLSLGSYLGGRIADRYHARRALAVLFGLASAACIGIVVQNNIVSRLTPLWWLSWPTHVFLHVSLVFFVPSMLLGMIGPVVARMALAQGLAVGHTIGSIYAWGAAGAIAATFFSGFFLIANFGTTVIIWSIGAALLAMAILYWLSCWAMYLWAMLFVALATMGMAPERWAQDAGAAALLRTPPDPNIIYDTETPYCHVAVKRLSRRPDRRAFLQDKLMRGEIVMDDVTNLQYFYTRIFAGLTHGLSKNRKDLSLMVIGGGGYAFPRYLQHCWPQSHVEVVEIDPGVTEAAVKAFGLPRDTPIKTVNRDARNYVNQLLQRERAGGTLPRFDFIYEDALNDYAVPFQLVTREFNDKIARLLAEDGVYLIHLIDTCENGQFLGAVVNTVRQTFPFVYVAAGQTGLPSLRDTFVVIAAQRRLDPSALLKEYDRHLKVRLLDEVQMGHLREQCHAIILTDDYAPAETLLAPVVRHSAREILAQRYLDEAVALQNRRQYEPSEARYRRALNLNPSLAVEAYYEIGMMRAAQGKLEGAAQAFRDAIHAHAESGGRQTTIASVHMNLGILLRRLGRPREAKEQLTQAAEWFRIELDENPASVVVWEWLGDTLATMEDFKRASEAFAKAAALEPRNPAHYEKLARTLEFQGRYGEAIEVVRQQIGLLQELGQRDTATQLGPYVDLLEYKKVKQTR